MKSVAPSAVQLQARIAGQGIAVELHNAGPAPLRVWQHDTPWGQTMFSLLVKPQGCTAALHLKAAAQRFTRAVPRWHEIDPGNSWTWVLAHDRPRWTGWEPDDDWLLLLVQVQVALHVAATPQAAAHGIACGHWVADALPSAPPHAWLTGAA